MPRHSQRCTSCDWNGDVTVAPYEMPPCPTCGGETERYYPIGARANAVIPDEFIGGKWIENIAPEPVFIESRSQYKRELASRGLIQKVRHVGAPGSDRHAETTRWI